jgi:Arf/Sar family protein
MGQALIAKMRGIFQKKKIELCLVGLENSGKTTLLNILSTGYPVETLPTVGLNVKMVKKEGVCMKVWDLGGQERFRAEWGRYTQGCDVIIYVIDSSDFDRVQLSRKELHKLLEDKNLSGLPILIALNKIDLDPHLTKDHVIEQLSLDYVTDNPWIVVPVSALRQINIGEVIDWLVAHSHS